ncbi:MAG: cobalt-precorrin 5A hydrolase [Paludibacter sp.]|nr:cobalt-precorrin 5A hydrolase [Paludibacter sp.]
MWALITVTANGLDLAKKLRLAFPDTDIYTLEKWKTDDCKLIEPDLKTCVGEIFSQYKALIFIMATGIVVRSIAPYLVHKTTDPAVVTLDDKGQFVISLLSGHLGGANEVTNLVADVLGATAVISTASDVNKVVSVDMLAKSLDLQIESMDDAKKITAMAVNGAEIGWLNATLLSISNPLGLINAENAEGLIVVSNKKQITLNKPYAQLIPRNIYLGIGCRRGVEPAKMIQFVTKQLSELDIHPASIAQIASVDIKSDELAILQTAAHFAVDTLFIEREHIKLLDAEFTSSSFVESTIGVSAVCEPCAFIAGQKKGAFLLRKTAFEGMTLAVFESETNIQSTSIATNILLR